MSLKDSFSSKSAVKWSRRFPTSCSALEFVDAIVSWFLLQQPRSLPNSNKALFVSIQSFSAFSKKRPLCNRRRPFQNCIFKILHFEFHSFQIASKMNWMRIHSRIMLFGKLTIAFAIPSLVRVSWPLYLEGLHPDPCLAWSEASSMHEGCCAVRGRTTGLAFVS